MKIFICYDLQTILLHFNRTYSLTGVGRDEESFLRISHGVVKILNPNLLERYHYMHVHSADPLPDVQTVILSRYWIVHLLLWTMYFIAYFANYCYYVFLISMHFLVWHRRATHWLWWKNHGNGQWQYKRVFYTVFHFSQVLAFVEKIWVCSCLLLFLVPLRRRLASLCPLRKEDLL